MRNSEINEVIQIIADMPDLPRRSPARPEPPSTVELYKYSYTPVVTSSKKSWKPSLATLMESVPPDATLDEYVVMQHTSRAGFSLAKRGVTKHPSAQVVIERFNKSVTRYNTKMELYDKELDRFYVWLNTVRDNLPKIIRVVKKITIHKYDCRRRYTDHDTIHKLTTFNYILNYTLDVQRSVLRDEFFHDGDFDSTEYISQLQSLAD